MEKEFYKLVCTRSDHGQRLDRSIHRMLPQYTRSFLQHQIEMGNIHLNGEKVKSGHKIRENDIIIVRIVPPVASMIIPQKMDLDIIYEDKHVIVINKPSGLVVHPGAGNYSGTLVNGLLHHCQDLSGINGVLRPGIVHRLDKNTSGLLVVAKNNKSHLMLARQFETKEIIRSYIALVWGIFDKKTGQIKSKIDRSRRDRKKMTVSQNGGREAVTNYRIIREYEFFSLIKLTLQTGRTHQIRVHLNHIHHPVFGDPEYAGRQTQIHRLPSSLRGKGLHLLKIIQRQALHARSLSFLHPETGNRLYFKSNIPDDFRLLLGNLPLQG